MGQGQDVHLPFETAGDLYRLYPYRNKENRFFLEWSLVWALAKH